jgi:hypothetical protein
MTIVTASAQTIGFTPAVLAIVIVIGTSKAMQAARFVIARWTMATQMIIPVKSVSGD